MKKRDLFFIIFIIILTIIMRSIFVTETTLGEDSHFHYSIVEQSLEKGTLSSNHDLVNCYEGVKNYHPIGYYIFHYYAARLIGLDNAFRIIPIIFAIFNILFAFYFISYLFNKRTAYISIFFIAISIANISKSAAQTFRGENLIYPFLLLSLIFGIKFLEERNIKKKLYFSVLAGFISGISSFIWSGYVLVIIILTASICSYLLYNFIKNKTNNGNLKFVALAFLIQLIIIKIISYFFINPGRNIFGREYYFWLIIIPLAIYLIILKILEKHLKNKNLYLFIALIIGGILLSFQEAFRNLIFNNLTKINKLSIFASPETTPPHLLNYLFYYGFLLITTIAGVIILFKNLNKKKIYFLGLMIPSIVLLVNVTRFIYFASIPLFILSAIFLDWFLERRKDRKKRHIAILLGFMILILISNLFLVQFFMRMRTLETDLVDSLEYIKANTEKESCIISSIDSRGLIPYLSKRYSYVTWQKTEKQGKLFNFLFTNSSPSFDINKSYILIKEKDIYYQLGLLCQYNITGIDTSIYLTKISNKTQDNYEETVYKDLYDDSLILTREYKDDIKAFVLKESNNSEKPSYYPIKDVYKGNKHYQFDGKANDACLFMGNFSVMYFNKRLCDSNIAKMMTWQDIPGLEKFYHNSRVRIYKIGSSSQQPQ